MPAFIPIFLLPIDGAQAAALRGPEAAEDAVAAVQGVAPEVSGLRIATSSNWWHSSLTLQLCKAWGVVGLEFLEQEMSVLSAPEALAAQMGCDTLLERLKGGPFPQLSTRLGPEIAALRSADRAAAADVATAAYEVDEATGDVHSFFQFLATVRQATHEAAQSGRHMLFLAPRP